MTRRTIKSTVALTCLGIALALLAAGYWEESLTWSAAGMVWMMV